MRDFPNVGDVTRDRRYLPVEAILRYRFDTTNSARYFYSSPVELKAIRSIVAGIKILAVLKGIHNSSLTLGSAFGRLNTVLV